MPWAVATDPIGHSEPSVPNTAYPVDELETEKVADGPDTKT